MMALMTTFFAAVLLLVFFGLMGVMLGLLWALDVLLRQHSSQETRTPPTRFPKASHRRNVYFAGWN